MTDSNRSTEGVNPDLNSARGKLAEIAYRSASMPSDLEPMPPREAAAVLNEMKRLQDELDMAHDQIRSLQRKVPPRSEPIRTHVREG